jgi:PKD repeat protein
MDILNTHSIALLANEPHSALWDIGDGSPAYEGIVDQIANNVTGTHSYDTPGVYTILLTVTDGAGNLGTATATEYIVTYDPSAGFVTGGGWINSPEGGYAPDPILTGRANFGFVSKYKKGANVPTGQTEFQFKVADLNFHSSSYDWLVVAGPKGQFKGTGTVSGSGNYGFMLATTDGAINGGGGEDKFRIKIWDKDGNDQIVYDNQPGDADDAETTHALGGGSIVIHKGNNLAKPGSPWSEKEGIPEEYALFQNFPNPFNPETEIRFQLPESAHVVLRVFNILGKDIRTLMDEKMPAGYYMIQWNGKDNLSNPLPSGIYLYQIKSGSFSKVMKMNFLR